MIYPLLCRKQNFKMEYKFQKFGNLSMIFYKEMKCLKMLRKAVKLANKNKKLKVKSAQSFIVSSGKITRCYKETLS